VRAPADSSPQPRPPPREGVEETHRVEHTEDQLVVPCELFGKVDVEVVTAVGGVAGVSARAAASWRS
jgi:hypothetical protein